MLIITKGFGNGVFGGSIKDVVTQGFNISAIIPSVIPIAEGIQTNASMGIGEMRNGIMGTGISSSQKLSGSVTGSGGL